VESIRPIIDSYETETRYAMDHGHTRTAPSRERISLAASSACWEKFGTTQGKVGSLVLSVELPPCMAKFNIVVSNKIGWLEGLAPRLPYEFPAQAGVMAANNKSNDNNGTSECEDDEEDGGEEHTEEEIEKMIAGWSNSRGDDTDAEDSDAISVGRMPPL
jgi:hypothetical protein